jgi:putative endonuclease
MPRICYVYILASTARHLYVGVTNDLTRRMHEHRKLRPGSYVARHRIVHLVYYEMAPDCRGAVMREKEIKRWRRMQRLELVESFNPEWRDLFEIPSRFEVRPPSPFSGAPG